jgi:murein DD-endopeptidase MepM/ murein hydrolase activator NlpD
MERSARGFAAAALLLLPFALAGCETAPPKTADYWPEPTYLTVLVHRGDTISAIAARYAVSPGAIERLNDLSARDAIYPGESLRLPAKSEDTRHAVLAEAEKPHYAPWNAPAGKSDIEVSALPAPAPHREPSHAAASAETHPAPQQSPRNVSVADRAPVVPTPVPAPSAPHHTPAGSFEWPVEGRIIAAFGRDGDGERNDGINIAADLGTPIHAAAAGTVTYAGNQLKGYGNLILIRHDNGYITAYAHAESMIVSAGDRVDRGDVIGYAGKTGDVTTPQVHFEVRQGVKPVDPRPLLLAARES